MSKQKQEIIPKDDYWLGIRDEILRFIARIRRATRGATF